MLFDSADFCVFFAVFLLLYFVVQNSLALRNILILAFSFFFYGYWDVHFLMLLVGTATLDFFVALRIESSRRPKVWLIGSLAANLGVLGYFKYCNFFIDSFHDL